MKYHYDRFAPHDPSRIMVQNVPPAGEVMLLYVAGAFVFVAGCMWAFTL